MVKIIKERERKSRTDYEMNFYRKDTNEICFGFPVIDGEVKPYPQGMENYLRVKDDERFYSVIEERESSWTEPAIAICECGAEITLDYDAQECEHCGRLHNLFGQELLPRECWGKEPVW